MSLTKATYSMISGAAANVVDYGADPTGVNNSTSAFAAAIAASKHIFIPQGTFLVDTILLNDVKGYLVEGASTTGTIIKGTASATKVLQVTGSTPGGLNTYNVFKNFTVDMTLMNSTTPGAAVGVFMKNTWGNSFYNVNVNAVTSSQRSILIDAHVYTSVFENCDFQGLTGVIEIAGFDPSITYSTTTLTFIGCSFGQCLASYVSGLTFIQPIAQGNLNKMQLSNVSSVTIVGGDIEGTGIYLAFGAGCENVFSINNALIGFAGIYMSGTLVSGQLLDQINSPYKFVNGGGTVASLEVNGIVDEINPRAQLTRKQIKNTNAAAYDVDIEFGNDAGETYVGMAANGDAYIDNRAGGDITIQQTGVKKLGVASTGSLYVNTTTAPTAGSLVGYLTFTNGTTTYKIPYYAA